MTIPEINQELAKGNKIKIDQNIRDRINESANNLSKAFNAMGESMKQLAENFKEFDRIINRK